MTDTTVQAARRILEYWGPDYGNEDEVIVARALLSLAERDLIEEAARVAEEATRDFCRGDSFVLGGPAAIGLSIAARIRALRASPPQSLADDTTRLREALQKAAAQFRFYEAEHRRKAEVNGDRAATLRKAETNQKFAEMCEAALIPAPPKGGER